jgi:hypothetical protein
MACLGFGRFALGMLLPSMGASLGLDYAQMGFISTGNFIGYLAAVFLSGMLTAQLGARRLITAGLAVVAASMMAVSQAQAYPQVLLLYFFTGFGAGTANVPIMALIAHWFERSLRGRAAGFIVSGSGVAIVFSGWMIPAINARVGPEGWRWSWLLATRAGDHRHRRDVICNARRSAVSPRTATPSTGLPSRPACRQARIGSAGGRRRRTLTHLAWSTSCSASMSFAIVTALCRTRFQRGQRGAILMGGRHSILSGPLGGLSDCTGRRAALMMVFAMHRRLPAGAPLARCVRLPLDLPVGIGVERAAGDRSGR